MIKLSAPQKKVIRELLNLEKNYGTFYDDAAHPQTLKSLVKLGLIQKRFHPYGCNMNWRKAYYTYILSSYPRDYYYSLLGEDVGLVEGGT